MTEAELLSAVIDCARIFGWRVAHFRPARTERGWRTPVQADGKGFPDLVLARAGEVVFSELKGDGGRVSPDQQHWIDELHPLSRLWCPGDWASGEIERALRPTR